MKSFQVWITVQADLYVDVIADDIDTARAIGEAAAVDIKGEFCKARMPDGSLTREFFYSPDCEVSSIDETNSIEEVKEWAYTDEYLNNEEANQ